MKQLLFIFLKAFLVYSICSHLPKTFAQNWWSIIYTGCDCSLTTIPQWCKWRFKSGLWKIKKAFVEKNKTLMVQSQIVSNKTLQSSTHLCLLSTLCISYTFRQHILACSHAFWQMKPCMSQTKTLYISVLLFKLASSRDHTEPVGLIETAGGQCMLDIIYRSVQVSCWRCTVFTGQQQYVTYDLSLEKVTGCVKCNKQPEKCVICSHIHSMWV